MIVTCNRTVVQYIILIHITLEGTKGVANAIKPIAVGTKRDMGKKWFPQLSDKSEYIYEILQFLLFILLGTLYGNATKCMPCNTVFLKIHLLNMQTDALCPVLTLGASTKQHAYWAMANCGGSGQQLQTLLLNIVEHYQVYNITFMLQLLDGYM